MASLYLDPELATQAHSVGDIVELREREAKHAATVARVRVGESIQIGDGVGLMVRGTVVHASSDRVRVRVTESIQAGPPSCELWLAQALAKGDRDELAIQASTELGIFGVIPWAAERSISKWQGPKVERGRERWRTIVAEASKQSIRAWVPVVGEHGPTTAILAGQPWDAIFVLEPDAHVPLSTAPLPAEGTAEHPTRILLVVGPEGGISDRERETFAAAGATEVRLGAEVLRTSTAGPAALAVLNVRLDRW